MYSREILKTISNADDRLMMARLLDKAELAEKTYKITNSDFLDPHQMAVASKMLANAGVCGYSFNGGYPEAERTIALFVPEFSDDTEQDQYIKRLLKVIEIVPKVLGLSHRDYLGALMGLGIKREVIGDIIVDDDRCSIIVLSDIAEFIAGNLLKVGNTGVTLAIKDISVLTGHEARVKEIRATVAALRLDTVCAQAFGISRSKAAELIKAGRVNLNWETVQSSDRSVGEGDNISIRGKGKAVLDKVGDRTKKDRIAVKIRKYI